MFLMDEVAIGANIRRVRERIGKTVTALAPEASITKATLSKIETGKVSSPISTLMRVADALSVPLSEFFIEAEGEPPYLFTPRGEGQLIERDGSSFGYSYEALAMGLAGKRGEPFLLTIQPGDPAGEFRHGGQEFIHVLSGRMAFTVAGDRTVMRKGDSLYFDATRTHRTEVLGKSPARFICMFLQDPPRPATRTRRGRRSS